MGEQSHVVSGGAKIQTWLSIQASDHGKLLLHALLTFVFLIIFICSDLSIMEEELLGPVLKEVS